MGVPPGGSRVAMVHFLSATPTVVAVVNSVLAGVIVALVALQAGPGTPLATALGVIAFVVAFVTHIVYVRRVLARTLAAYRPLFPGTEGD
jgi:putative flippase GtrA